MDVGGTSIKTGAVRFDDGADDPRIEVGPSLPTNSNGTTDVVLDSLAAAADGALDVAGRDVSGLAIAICGPFDIDAGVSLMRGVHKFEEIYGIDLRAALRDRSTVSGTADPVRPRRRIRRYRRVARRGRRRCRPGPDHDRGYRARHVPHRSGTAGRVHQRLRRRASGDAGDRLGRTCRRRAVGTRPCGSAGGRHGRSTGGRERSHQRRCRQRPRQAAGHVPGTGRRRVRRSPCGDRWRILGAFDRFGPALQSAIGTVPVRPAALGIAGPLLGAAHLTFRP